MPFLTKDKGHFSKQPLGDVVVSFSQSLLVLQELWWKMGTSKNDAYAYDGGNPFKKFTFLFHLGSISDKAKSFSLK